MSAYSKEGNKAKEKAYVIPSSNGIVKMASPSFSSQPHLRVIVLIIESCGQLIYEGLVLAAL